MKPGKKAALIISSGIILISLGHQFISRALHPLTVICVCDPLFSLQAQKSIQERLAQEYARPDIQTLLLDLQKAVPTAHALSRRVYAEGTAVYTVTAETPCARIGKELLLTRQGVLRPSFLFTPHLLDTLPCCTAAENKQFHDQELAALRNFATQSLGKLAHEYDVTWENKTQILLRKKGAAHSSLIITSWQPIDDLFLKKSRSAEQLLAPYEQKRAQRKADLRCRDFIVISA